MAKLIYSAIASLDGYVEDEDGKFDWAEPDQEVHAFVNDLERPVGTYLYGRRLYETMAGWETDPGLAEHSPVMRDFAAIWQAAEKIVYSRTLEAVSTTRTRIEREFHPDAVRQEKRQPAATSSWAEPVSPPRRSGPVSFDELHLFLTPVLVGGGKHALPEGVNLRLELLDERRFRSGTVFLRYRSASSEPMPERG